VIGWRKGKQQTLTMQNGIPCDGINTLIRDHRDDLWLYTQCGLVQISERELQRWWSDPGIKVNMRIFDSIDGVQPGLAPFQGAALDPDGKLWFANESVLQVIDPDHLPRNPVPPPVHVEEVTADRRAFSTMAGLKLPALTRDIAIRYTALSFVAPQSVYFRYMLEGQDNTWQEAHAITTAYGTKPVTVSVSPSSRHTTIQRGLRFSASPPSWVCSGCYTFFGCDRRKNRLNSASAHRFS
jgi:hypothetical protein